jgi:short-subunit dehydrogenase
MMEKRTALITGASQGIGLEFARICAREGYDLVLVARDKTRLKEIAQELARKEHVEVKVIGLDLSKNDSVERLAKEFAKNTIEIDLLINNAGFGNLGEFTSTDLEKEHRMIQLNIVALTDLTKFFAKEMVKRKSGTILNVSSVAAFLPGPYMSVYYATKAYVLSLSLALAKEVEEHGVSVTTLCPGPTKSEFQQRAGMKNALLFKSGMMDADEVAWAGYRGAMLGRKLVVPGIHNKLSVFLIRFAPRSLLMRIVARLQKKRS